MILTFLTDGGAETQSQPEAQSSPDDVYQSHNPFGGFPVAQTKIH